MRSTLLTLTLTLTFLSACDTDTKTAAPSPADTMKSAGADICTDFGPQTPRDIASHNGAKLHAIQVLAYASDVERTPELRAGRYWLAAPLVRAGQCI